MGENKLTLKKVVKSWLEAYNRILNQIVWLKEVFFICETIHIYYYQNPFLYHHVKLKQPHVLSDLKDKVKRDSHN